MDIIEDPIFEKTVTVDSRMRATGSNIVYNTKKICCDDGYCYVSYTESNIRRARDRIKLLL